MQIRITSQGHTATFRLYDTVAAKAFYNQLPLKDLIMLYKDFYAGDEMHRIGINVAGIEEIAGMSGKAIIEKKKPNRSEARTAMKISVKADGKATVFEINDSTAARELYAQLPRQHHSRKP